MQIIKLLFLILFLNSVAAAQVIINEFMADNVSINADMIDYDDYSDWIELYNNQNITADLSGYYITDNLNKPYKWKIPDGTTIPPHGFLVLRADGFDAAPGKISTKLYSPWETFTVKNYHTNFKLEFLGEEIGLFKGTGIVTRNLISAGSDWKYLDDGSNQGSAWKEQSFNDDSWKTGSAQFGYGDGDETTIINYGSNSNNKFITTYFRKTIQVIDAARIASLILNLLRDDGAVVFLNGHEIARTNMPAGDFDFSTEANSAVSSADENLFFTFELANSFLLEGENVIAVELHQSGAQSSDLGFDLELSALVFNETNKLERIDSVFFKRQLKDVSMGRNPDDNFNWYFYGEPTPGSANNTNATLSNDYSGTVTFSINGGFYDNQQTLMLSSQSTDEQIYYTTDGSFPTTKSLKYSLPIIITQNMVVRARTFAANKLPGEIKSNNYFINEVKSNLSALVITADPSTMWDDETGIYKNNIKGRDIPIAIEYFEPGGYSAFKVNAGARIGGFDIWRFAQKPLNFSLKNKYGNDFIPFQLFEGKPIAAFSEIGIRNGGDNWSTSFIIDDMAESIVKGQMQTGVAAYKPNVVYINGEYWGIYDLRERFDPQYFASNYNVDPDNIEHLGYEPVPPPSDVGLVIFEGAADSYNNLLSFAANNNMALKENYDFVKSQLDIDDFINYLSLEVYICNTSWRHNREFWRPKSGDGKWRWLIQDIDRGFNLQNLNSNILDDYASEYSLLNNLLKNPEFKDKFIQQSAAHLNSTFAGERIINIVDSLSSLIAKEMPRHIERWKNDNGIQSMTSWNSALDRIRQFASQRVNNVFNHINNEFGLTGTSVLNINSPNTGTILINGIPLCAGLSNLKFFKNIPMKITAVPNSGYRFAGWAGISDSSSISFIMQGDTTINALFEPSQEIMLPEIISVNTSLSITENDYISNSDLIISPGVTLKIGKGVNLKLPDHASIYVKGNLIIEGTEDQPVSIMPNVNAGAEKWGALVFDNSTGNNLISNVIIKNASHGKDIINHNAAVSSNKSDLVLDHLFIENVNFPIFVQGGSTVLKNSTLSATGTCDYIGIKRGKGLIENNIFLGNKYPDTDAIDLDGDSSVIVRNNKIYNFSGFNCDGIDIGEESKNILITGNIIYNSTDKGISIGQLSDAIIEKNVIVSCDMGIAVKDNSYASIINNTFSGNNIAVACYEKNYGDGAGIADVRNSILSASKVSSFFADSLSTVNISYSLSDMEILPGTNNLFGEPLFINEYDYNFQLKSASSCFNSGDPALPNDPDGSRIDIGAYYLFNEYDIPKQVRESNNLSVVINEIMYNDGGIVDTKDWIELYNPTNQSIDISGWKLTDEDSTHIFIIPSGTIIDSDKFLVICKNGNQFSKMYPDVQSYIGNLDFGFDGNDKVMLYKDSQLISFVSYTNESPWPLTADGGGSSLELRNPFGFNYLTTNWKASEGTGTPGRQNSVYVPTYADDMEFIPDHYILAQNYPNPFNPTTNIVFEIPAAGFVELKVFDILGREIATLVNEVKSPGKFNVAFEGANLSSGIYFYRIKTKDFISARKMMLLK